jgi:preprotein translocase subunit SecD
MSNLRWKLTSILAVLVVFSAVGVYPLVAQRLGITEPSWLIERALKLGLDLKGGVHLVLRVQTDKALLAQTESDLERLRQVLTDRSIPFTSVASTGPTSFRVEGIPSGQEAPFRDAAADLDAVFNRSPGTGGSFAFAMKPNIEIQLRREAVTQARQTIERRVNELGVTEPQIAAQGTNGDQILVQLPGVTDVAKAKTIMGSTGFLELKIVERMGSTREELLTNGLAPEGMEVVPGTSGVPGEPPAFYLLRRAAAVTGRDLRNARPSIDQNNRPAVSFTLNPEGGRKFGAVTSANIGRQLAIVLDGRVQSAPRIDGRITTDGQIFGSFTPEEVQNLSLILRSGALPADLDYLEERTIGPSLGADSIRSGVTASLVGLLLIILFMMTYYKLSGLNAVVALLFNLIILLGLMAYVGAVMTLPGIAGFILTIGLGVDSNVLIFERIKEELEAQRGVRASINAGFSRVFLTLVDTHLAGFIAAAFLFLFGTGPIRGFAVTLSLGLVANLFTSTFVSKTIFELVLSRSHQTARLSI